MSAGDQYGPRELRVVRRWSKLLMGARNCPMNLGSVGRRPEWSTGAQSCPEMVEAAHGSSELPYESRKCRQEIGMVHGSSGLSGHARNCPRKVGVVPSHIWGRNSSVLKKNTISNLQRRIEMYAQGLQRTVLCSTSHYTRLCRIEISLSFVGLG